jgi:hypothetical protein
MSGVLVPLRSNGIIGTDFFADTTATTVVLYVFDLANNRYRGEALLWIGHLPLGENHAPTLYLAFDGTEGTC